MFDSRQQITFLLAWSHLVLSLGYRDSSNQL
jgi:hypothetical protein